MSKTQPAHVDPIAAATAHGAAESAESADSAEAPESVESVESAKSSDSVESVWDYPRPPRLERTSRRIRIVHRGIVLADTTRALRLLETSHPPTYYLPPADVAREFLTPSAQRGSFCEFKGVATYWTVDVSPARTTAASAAVSPGAAWSYPKPSPAYAALRDHLAFYASRVDLCTVDGEAVQPQPGDFYGGWITSHVRGPFKGPPGTLGW